MTTVMINGQQTSLQKFVKNKKDVLIVDKFIDKAGNEYEANVVDSKLQFNLTDRKEQNIALKLSQRVHIKIVRFLSLFSKKPESRESKADGLIERYEAEQLLARWKKDFKDAKFKVTKPRLVLK